MFNKDLFSDVLKKINSNYETMTEFSKKADLDRTYISKYINKKLENPPSPDILKKIAEASNGIVSYYELMEICDYIDLSSVFLLNNGYETNLCYWNKEDLKDMGFSQQDINQLLYLANNKDVENRSGRISNILNKYPEDILNSFYDKAICQTNLQKGKKEILSLNELKIRLTKLIEDSESLLKLNNKKTLKELYKDTVPLLGTVKAGYNYIASENILDYIPVTFKKEDDNYYALKIKGESMEPILSEGDTVIVHKQDFFESGKFCIVLINGEEATVKKVYKLEDGIELIALNPAYPSKKYTKDDMDKIPVKVIGVVKQLIKKLD